MLRESPLNSATCRGCLETYKRALTFRYRRREAHAACSPQRFHGFPSAVHVFNGGRILSRPATRTTVLGWKLRLAFPPLQNRAPTSSGALQVRFPFHSHQGVVDCQVLFAYFRCLGLQMPNYTGIMLAMPEPASHRTHDPSTMSTPLYVRELSTVQQRVRI